MIKSRSILRDFFDACQLRYDLMVHDLDRALSMARVRISLSEAKKKSVVQSYNQRLADRFKRSLDAGSRATEKANGFPAGTVKNRRQRATRDLLESIKHSPHI